MRPIVLLHGFTGSPESWRRITPLLEAPLVLAPALVGHTTRVADVTSFDDELDRLAATISALPAPAHLAGYSLGARLALGLLLRHPALFASATLIGVHPGLVHPSERAARRLADEVWCDLLEREGVPAFVAAWEAQPLFAAEARLPRREREAQRAIRLSHGAAGLIHSLRTTGLGVMPSYAARLRELDLAVDVLVGERDTKFCALARSFVPSLSAGTLEVIAGAGHNLLMERPDVVARTIARGART